MRSASRFRSTQHDRPTHRPKSIHHRDQELRRTQVGRTYTAPAARLCLLSWVLELVHQRAWAQRGELAGLCEYVLEGDVYTEVWHFRQAWWLVPVVPAEVE
jgi:hypothetical protein